MEAADTRQRFCGQCGAELDETHAKFCGECGSVTVAPQQEPLPRGEPHTKRGALVWGGLAVLLLVLRLTGSSLFGDLASGKQEYVVEYRVTGTAERASLTLQNESGGTSQTEVSIPWVHQFKAASGQFVYISAQNKGSTGTVQVAIQVNGRVIQDAQSSGEYVIAAASGQVGE